tara:strand:+ start:412 stop:684 length:273 start_codon:yes stop_codon:yes gene_type:complete
MLGENMKIRDFAYQVDDFILDYYMAKGFLPGVYLGVGSLGDTRLETAEFRIQDKRVSDIKLLELLKKTFPQGKFWIQYENNIFFEHQTCN